MAKKPITPQELVKRHEMNVRASLEENGLSQHLIVHFPKLERVPALARFAVWVVQKYGGIIATKYVLTSDTITSKSRRR